MKKVKTKAIVSHSDKGKAYFSSQKIVTSQLHATCLPIDQCSDLQYEDT